MRLARMSAVLAGAAAMLVVAALGRSALDTRDPAALVSRVRAAARALAGVAQAHRLVVVHGNALPAGTADADADVRCAAAAGVLGHLLARELRNALPAAGVVALQAS